jgi:hypothetical protein
VLPDLQPAAVTKFEQFHRANPHIYRLMDRLAHDWIASTGRHKLGIAALYERARWELAIQTGDPDFKLNNNHRAFYARLLMMNHPELRGLFDLRPSVADGWANSKMYKS